MRAHSKRLALTCTVAALACLASVAVPAAVDGTNADAEALARKYIEVWNGADPGVIDTILAADVTRRGPAPRFSTAGREGLEQAIAATRATYRDFAVSIESVRSDGDRVVLSWSCTGTYSGSEYPEAAGRKLDVSGTSVFRVADGMIAHENVSWDYLRGYEQLGVVDPILDESDQNEELLLGFIRELYEKGDMDAAHELVTDDFVFHVPAGKEGAIGPKGAQQRAAVFRAAFPDLKFTVGETVADGNLVATRWTFEGTHRGTFLGHEQTGKKVTIAGLSLARIEGGKIVEAWGVWDRGDLLEQIGR